MEKIFVSFDIDGTLIKFGGESAKHPIAFRNAFNILFHMNIKEYPLDYLGHNNRGLTDSTLLSKMMEKAHLKFDKNIQKKFRTILEKEYKSIVQPQFDLTPNAESFLNELSNKKNVTLGIATGNFKEIAAIKLSFTHLDKYLPLDIGGYGDLFSRRDIIINALKSAYSHGKGPFDRMIHIGDTVQDAQGAISAGFEPFIVTTGKEKSGFPKESFVCQDFKTDYEKIFKYLRL